MDKQGRRMEGEAGGLRKNKTAYLNSSSLCESAS